MKARTNAGIRAVQAAFGGKWAGQKCEGIYLETIGEATNWRLKSLGGLELHELSFQADEASPALFVWFHGWARYELTDPPVPVRFWGLPGSSRYAWTLAALEEERRHGRGVLDRGRTFTLPVAAQ